MFPSINRNKLKYRRSTQAFIIRNNKILIFQGVDFPDNMWSLPGGRLKGIECAEDALIRELNEEFPKNTFKILKRSEVPLIFEWSDEMIQEDLKSKGYSYRGQNKIQFLVSLNEEDIISYDSKEIRNIRWIS